MTKNDVCSGCTQKHDCKTIYGTLGNAQGQSVVRKVIFVFLFPIAVFIASIAVLGFFLKEWIASESVRTAVTFGASAAAAIASAGLVRWCAPAWGRPGGSEEDENLQHGCKREKDI